jgi:dTDP-4-amino-4,6-dideoxygalactose transaminase
MIKLTQLDTEILNIDGYFSDVKNLMSSMIMGGIYCESNIQVEEKLSKFLGLPCTLTSSGTSALIMALEYAIIQAKNKPIMFCVSEFLYFSMHSALKKIGYPIQILKANSDEVTITPAEYHADYYHIFLLTSHHNTNVDIEAATKNIPNHSKFIIEDRCLVFGTPSTNLSDVSCYSFSNNKMIIAGEGGLLVTKNKEMIEWAKLRSFSNINPTINNKLFMYMGNYSYIPTWPPSKYSMSAIVSLLISRQLDVLTNNISKRKENYKILNENLKFNKDKIIPEAPLFYTLHLPKKYTKRELNKIQIKLFKQNIITQLGVLPYGYFEDQKLLKDRINIPVHSCLSENDLEHLIYTINDIL